MSTTTTTQTTTALSNGMLSAHSFQKNPDENTEKCKSQCLMLQKQAPEFSLNRELL